MPPRQVQALSFEDIRVGQKVRLEQTVAPDLIDAFASLTGDVNPLHASDEFARSKGFGGRIAHGLLVGSFFSTIAGTMLPGRDCLLQETRFSFKKPVPAGTFLVLEAVVAQKVEAYRTVVLELTARDAAGDVVLSGRLQAGFLP